MRGIVATAGVVVALVASSASAHTFGLLPLGASSAYFEFPGYYAVDGGVDTNGFAYQVDFLITSDDPNATFTHSGPNDIQTYDLYRLEDGSTQSEISFLPVAGLVTWTVIDEKPGIISYLLRTPAPTPNTCSSPATTGQLCFRSYSVILNSATLLVTANAPITVTQRVTAVPEPQTWALMLAGFGIAGATLRRRRAPA